jgi:predicted component of type VI protein secretion system
MLMIIKSLVCSLLLTLASSAAMADGNSPADQVSASDARAVRAVVEAQLKALAAEEAVQAFSYASPAIKSQFHDAATFAEMVRRSYPMLIRPASISFMRPEAGERATTTITQAVQFRDREGNFWRAVYELELQPDKSWRINGCAVAPDDDSLTT